MVRCSVAVVLCGELGAAAHAEFPVDVAEVVFDGFGADDELGGDFFVGGSRAQTMTSHDRIVGTHR